MVDLNTLILTSILAGGAGVVGTICLGLLVNIYLNTRPPKDEDVETFTIPMSALTSIGGRGHNRDVLTYEDLARMYAAQAAAPKKETDKDTKGGQYL